MDLTKHLVMEVNVATDLLNSPFSRPIQNSESESGGVSPSTVLRLSPACENMTFTALMNIPSSLPPLCFQIVKVWSEDGAGKVVEIPADMTARDVCQLLVYKSHCLDDNAWTLVEHHPILGLGKVVFCVCSTLHGFGKHSRLCLRY